MASALRACTADKYVSTSDDAIAFWGRDLSQKDCAYKHVPNGIRG